MQTMAEYLRQLEDPAFQATNRHALAGQGLDIQLLEVYRVIHEPTGASVDVLKSELDAEAARVGAYSVHQKRAVLLRIVTERLKSEASRLLPSTTAESTRE